MHLAHYNEELYWILQCRVFQCAETLSNFFSTSELCPLLLLLKITIFQAQFLGCLGTAQHHFRFYQLHPSASFPTSSTRLLCLCVSHGFSSVILPIRLLFGYSFRAFLLGTRSPGIRAPAAAPGF